METGAGGGGGVSSRTQPRRFCRLVRREAGQKSASGPRSTGRAASSPPAAPLSPVTDGGWSPWSPCRRWSGCGHTERHGGVQGPACGSMRSCKCAQVDRFPASFHASLVLKMQAPSGKNRPLAWHHGPPGGSSYTCDFSSPDAAVLQFACPQAPPPASGSLQFFVISSRKSHLHCHFLHEARPGSS